ncbi:MAG: tRNA glutamyl-Q(34) synthetase GluQRS [Gammaproteobacteria bacterium]|nr:tRNA glutamyl-Q(34) synthetase GluQRS [Gammaproteobacteria bacterium]
MLVKTLSQSQPQVLPYRGRFAPSPTGPLHFGSLVTAVASYLEAKTRQGHWLLRMEDLDPPREIPTAADDILRTLENHGLQWDESILFQSQRHEAYDAAIHRLRLQGLIYHCNCSRKKLLERQGGSGLQIYPGTCRKEKHKPSSQSAIRIITDNQEIGFEDRIQGYFGHNIGQAVGDFVLLRADGWFAYQLAVVVDDAEQGVSDIVRGSDLLDNTPRQIYLQQLLSFDHPTYAHVPVVANQKGEKLSKQTSARAVSDSAPNANLFKALDFLGQQPPAELVRYELRDIWQWACQNWHLDKVPKRPKIALDV